MRGSRAFLWPVLVAVAIAGAGCDGGSSALDAGFDAASPPVDANTGMTDSFVATDADGMDDAAMEDAAMEDGGPPDAAADAAMDDGGSVDDGGVACTDLPAAGSSITLMGTLDDGSMRWFRVDDDTCPATALASDEEYAYDAFVLCPPATDRTIDVRLEGADCDSSLTLPDPWLVLYGGDTIPSDPLACLASNDDDYAGKTLCSQIVDQVITAGSTTLVVATSLDPIGPLPGIPPGGGGGPTYDGFGTYRVTITGR